MAELKKKSKDDKIAAVNKIPEYLEKYNTVVLALHSSIQNKCLQRLRSSLDATVVFAKKSLLQRKFPALCHDEDFFLIFTNDTELDKLQAFEFNDFIRVGEASPIDHVIPAGPIRNERQAALLQPIEKTGALSVLKEDYTVIQKGQVADEKAVELERLFCMRAMPRRLTILSSIESKSLNSL